VANPDPVGRSSRAV